MGYVTQISAVHKWKKDYSWQFSDWQVRDTEKCVIKSTESFWHTASAPSSLWDLIFTVLSSDNTGKADLSPAN